MSPDANLRYLFRHCVEARVVTTVRPDVWAVSLDEALTSFETARCLEGYKWGVKWQCLYPGGSLVEGSERAAAWEQRVGIPFHEAVIEGNGHSVSLVFGDLCVSEVSPGYVPFRLDEP